MCSSDLSRQGRKVKRCPSAVAEARLSTGAPECVRHELGERDGPGQRFLVEIAGFAPAQQLFALGVPGEAALALEELGEDHAGLGRIACGEPS